MDANSEQSGESNTECEKNAAPADDSFQKISLLPTELKDQILRERLLFSSPISAIRHSSHSLRALMRLVLVSKELKGLSRETYYGENRFEICRGRKTNPKLSYCGLEVLRYPHPAAGTLVRKLEVHLNLSHVHSSRRNRFGAVKQHDRWANNSRFLLIEPATNDIVYPAIATWQKCFPNLEHLHFVLDYDNENTMNDCLGVELLKAVRELQNDSD